MANKNRKRNYLNSEQKSNSNSSRSQNRNRKNAESGYSPKEDAKVGADRLPGKNDATWYASDPELLASAASFPYAWPVGYPLPRGVIANVQSLPWRVGEAPGSAAVAGIMSLRFKAVPGVTRDNFSAINIASRNIYAWVRHQNSGHSNYDPVDLMLYLYAMDSIYTYYSWMCRLYGTLNLYTYENKYLPKALVTAMGVDFDNLEKHIADFKYYIDLYAEKIGSLCVPSTMYYYTRHIWMTTNLFSDENVAKAQIYFFTPDALWKYNEYEGAGQLDSVAMPGPESKWTYENIVTRGNSLVNAVMSSEDIGIMSGDILKCYGLDKIIKVIKIAHDYVVTPVHNVEALSQIQNCTILGPVDDNPITQDVNTGALLYEINRTGDPDFTRSYGRRHIINMYKQDVTPADTMVATRLTCGYTDAQPDQLNPAISVAGSEVITVVDLFNNTTDTNGDLKLVWERLNSNSISLTTTSGDVAASTVFSGLRVASLLSQFDYHPCIELSIVTNSDIRYAGQLFDIGNYTTISNADLDKMHQTALISLFNVPKVGVSH